MRQGDFARAEDFANQVLVRSPNFGPAALLLADLNLRKGNAPAAIASLIGLLKQQPKLASKGCLAAWSAIRSSRIQTGL